MVGAPASDTDETQLNGGRGGRFRESRPCEGESRDGGRRLFQELSTMHFVRHGLFLRLNVVGKGLQPDHFFS
jgi:hypothetical protein